MDYCNPFLYTYVCGSEEKDKDLAFVKTQSLKRLAVSIAYKL